MNYQSNGSKWLSITTLSLGVYVARLIFDIMKYRKYNKPKDSGYQEKEMNYGIHKIRRGPFILQVNEAKDKMDILDPLTSNFLKSIMEEVGSTDPIGIHWDKGYFLSHPINKFDNTFIGIASKKPEIIKSITRYWNPRIPILIASLGERQNIFVVCCGKTFDIKVDGGLYDFK